VKCKAARNYTCFKIPGTSLTASENLLTG